MENDKTYLHKTHWDYDVTERSLTVHSAGPVWPTRWSFRFRNYTASTVSDGSMQKTTGKKSCSKDMFCVGREKSMNTQRHLSVSI
jgi:hypothetical protein